MENNTVGTELLEAKAADGASSSHAPLVTEPKAAGKAYNPLARRNPRPPAKGKLLSSARNRPPPRASTAPPGAQRRRPAGS
jgi:hypothetical protein